MIDSLNGLPMENEQACRGAVLPPALLLAHASERNISLALPRCSWWHTACLWAVQTSDQPGCSPSWESMRVCVPAHGGAEGRHELDHVSCTVL